MNSEYRTQKVYTDLVFLKPKGSVKEFKKDIAKYQKIVSS